MHCKYLHIVQDEVFSVHGDHTLCWRFNDGVRRKACRNKTEAESEKKKTPKRGGGRGVEVND